jgi:hypothetical protein
MPEEIDAARLQRIGAGGRQEIEPVESSRSTLRVRYTSSMNSASMRGPAEFHDRIGAREKTIGSLSEPEIRFHVKSNFPRRIKLIWVVQSPTQKYFVSQLEQISSLSRAVLFHRGALRNVINAGWDADAIGTA